MAHYAFLDENGIVTEVIAGRDEHEGIDWESHYSEVRGQVCKRTSYWTRGGVHAGGGVAYRKNFAGIGFTFDADRDAFIPPRPDDSHVLDDLSCTWIEVP